MRITLRGDSGFCREDLMNWCEQNQLDYVLGLAKNERLKVEMVGEQEQAAQYRQTGLAARAFREFPYQARESWSRARRVRRLLEIYFLRSLPVEAGDQCAVASLTQYGLWVIGLLVGLKVLNINLTAIAVVAGALGVGIGFGLQNVVANFVSGLMLLSSAPFGSAIRSP